MLKFSHAESGWTEARLHHTINYFTESKLLFFNRNFSLTVSILLDCWRLWLWNEYFSITDFSCSLLATFTSFDIRNYNSALSLLMAMLSHFFQHLVPPSFEYISNDTTVKENDDIVLFCNSTGHPPPRITWTILSGSKARIVGHEEYLNLFNVSRTQAGTYQCTASNNVTSSKTTKVQVTINCKNRIIDPLSFILIFWQAW